MANTQDFENYITQLLSESIPMTRPAMPEIAGYCTPIRLKGHIVGGKVEVPVVQYVGDIQQNPTNFETHNDTVMPAESTLVAYSAQFGFNAPNQNSGLVLKMLLASHLSNIEKSVQTAINSVISAANFSAAVVTVSSGSYAVANLETLQASVPNRSVTCIAPAYYVKTKRTWLPAGEEDNLRELSHLTGLPDYAVGFAARPEAIAFVYGYPSVGPIGEVTTSMIRLPIGIDVQFSRWLKRGGRSWCGSLDLVCSAEVGQTGALRWMKSE